VAETDHRSVNDGTAPQQDERMTSGAYTTRCSTSSPLPAAVVSKVDPWDMETRRAPTHAPACLMPHRENITNNRVVDMLRYSPLGGPERCRAAVFCVAPYYT
jgi:hypothetical protein